VSLGNPTFVLMLYVNGVALPGYTNSCRSTVLGRLCLTLSGMVYLNAGDVLMLVGNSNGNATSVASADLSVQFITV
jgi:hypothetical protein